MVWIEDEPQVYHLLLHLKVKLCIIKGNVPDLLFIFPYLCLNLRNELLIWTEQNGLNLFYCAGTMGRITLFFPGGGARIGGFPGGGRTSGLLLIRPCLGLNYETETNPKN